MEKTDIGPLSHSDYNKKNPCFLCSRLRRKRIFEIAAEKDCNKIAFAHHKDDIMRRSYQPFLREGDQHHDAEADDLSGEASYHPSSRLYRGGPDKKICEGKRLPAAKNKCPTSNTSRRIYIKKLLKKMERDNKNIRDNIYKALRHIKNDYLPQDMKDMK